MKHYIDLHCDTLMRAALEGRREIGRMEQAMVDPMKNCKYNFYSG